MTGTEPPPLQDVDHIHVFVNDRVAAEQWYDRVLGLRRVREYEFWATDGGPLTISNPTGTIHLALFERPAQKRHSTVALSVTARDLLAWKRHLQATLDQSIDVVDHELSMSLYFYDPDGNPYEITSYEHDAVRALLRGG